MLEILLVLVYTFFNDGVVDLLILNEDEESGQQRLAHQLDVVEVSLLLVGVLTVHELGHWHA